jgi:hypothetical protein
VDLYIIIFGSLYIIGFPVCVGFWVNRSSSILYKEESAVIFGLIWPIALSFYFLYKLGKTIKVSK